LHPRPHRSPLFPYTTLFRSEIGAQVLHVDPPPPSSLNSRVPPQLDRIITRALAKKADDRYQTAAELAADLKAVKDLLPAGESGRSEEHTSELQSRGQLVCRL